MMGGPITIPKPPRGGYRCQAEADPEIIKIINKTIQRIKIFFIFLPS